MSFLKRLFGGGAAAAPAFGTVEHEGFTIQPEPMPEGGQYRLAAVISKEINGEVRTHRLIRADLFTDADQAAEFAVTKAKQVIGEQGDHLFR